MGSASWEKRLTTGVAWRRNVCAETLRSAAKGRARRIRTSIVSVKPCPWSRSSPSRSTNRYFSGKEKYSWTTRYPRKRRSGVGRSVSSSREAHRPESLRPQDDRRGVGRRGLRAELDGERVVEEQLVERVDDLAFALQVEAEPRERALDALGRLLLQLGERGAPQDPQVEVEHRPRVAAVDRDGGRLLEAGRLHLDGPDRDRIGGPEAARDPVDGGGRERRALRDRLSRLEAHLLGVEDELHHGHRRHGRQERGVQDPEERFRDLRELVVDLEAHARREEGEGLEEALDVRVLALVRLELQAGRDLRVLVRELGPHLAKEAQLALVVLQEVAAHHSPFTAKLPLPS